MWISNECQLVQAKHFPLQFVVTRLNTPCYLLALLLVLLLRAWKSYWLLQVQLWVPLSHTQLVCDWQEITQSWSWFLEAEDGTAVADSVWVSCGYSLTRMAMITAIQTITATAAVRRMIRLRLRGWIWKTLDKMVVGSLPVGVCQSIIIKIGINSSPKKETSMSNNSFQGCIWWDKCLRLKHFSKLCESICWLPCTTNRKIATY